MLNWFSFLFLLIFVHIDSAPNNIEQLQISQYKPHEWTVSRFQFHFVRSGTDADKWEYCQNVKRKHFSYQNLCISNCVVFIISLHNEWTNMWMNWFPMNETNEFSAAKKKWKEETSGDNGLCDEILNNEKQLDDETIFEKQTIHLSENQFCSLLCFKNCISIDIFISRLLQSLLFLSKIAWFLFCRQEKAEKQTE